VIKGLHIPEERLLAGRLASALYLTGATTAVLLLLMPGVSVAMPAVVIAIAAAGALWGVLGLTVVPWRTAPPLVSHISTGMGLPITAAVMAASGGAQSPARFYVLFVLFYCSYFYVPREAVAYVLGCMAVVALPLAYDHDAVAGGYLGELVVIVPTYAMLGGLIVAAKALQVELRERADALAHADALTGVANRRAFEAAMARGRGVAGERALDRVGVLLVDLDDFKSANTVYGLTGGDRVLRLAAEALREAARGNDLVARLGGDEFAILASGADERGTARIADRVLEALARADATMDMPGYRLTASVGWATYPRPVPDKGQLYERADRALAAAKASGKSTGRPADAQAISRILPVSTS
jgi:diguanylate cyclase (GGDEF)-like protein